MNIYEIMQRNASDDGTFSEGTLNKISELTGLDQAELFEIYESGKQEQTPNGNPAKWKRSDKLNFINENGRDAYKSLVDSHKHG